ncbi:MAG: protein kinase [Planctomycetes bacterium]|nr:protein kinase [Planctomycetota bacterium]
MTLSESTPSHEMIGRSIGGCTIVDLIGQGAVGDVFRAKQLSLNRIVAIKVLARELNRNAALIKRFQREARSVAQLSHQNIAAVYDFGSAGDTHYIIMEFVDGRSLDGIVQEVGRLEPPVALNYITQAAAGIAHAQKANILHRDIKPGNLLVSREGVVKVVDFGLAKSEAETSTPDLTSLGAMLGTPNYMSPEQCSGGRVTSASDVYCLGGTFYRLVTGQTCFPSNNPVAVMIKHQSEEALPPYLFRPDLPAGYSEVMMKMLAKRPEDRYASAGEVLYDLECLKDGRTPKAAASPFGAPPVEAGFLDDSHFVLGALQYKMVTPDQVRTAVHVQAQLREIEVEERLHAILLKKGFVAQEKIDFLYDAIRRTRRQQMDQAFLALAQERGLIAAEQVQFAQKTLREHERAGRSIAACHVLMEREMISPDEIVAVLRSCQEREEDREAAAFRDATVRLGLAKAEALDSLLAAARPRRTPSRHQRLDQMLVSEGVLSRQKIQEIFRARLLGLSGGEAAALPLAGPAAAAAPRHPAPESTGHPARPEAAAPPRRRGSILPSLTSLKMEKGGNCPFCSKPIPIASLFCPFCMHKLPRPAGSPTPAARPGQAQTTPTAPPPGQKPPPVPAHPAAYVARLASGEASPPLSGEVVARLASEGKITRETPLQTPFSEGRWVRAGSIQKLARYFGFCHACQKPVAPDQRKCPHCQADF